VFYEDVKTCPRAVGLGFAGNAGGDLALASPMKQVLKAMKKVKPKGTATMVGCDPVGSAGGFAASAAVDFWDDRDAEVRVAQRVQRRNERAILELPEVAAIGVGRGSVDRDELVFKVFVTDADSGRYIPERVEGIRTEIVVSGRFYAK